MADPVFHELAHVFAVRQDLSQINQRFGCRFAAYQLGQFQESFLSGRAQEFENVLRTDFFFAAGDALVENAEAVTHGAVRVGRDDAQRIFRNVDADFAADVCHAGHERVLRNPLEIKAHASGQNRCRKLLYFGGCQNEGYIFRRFFQGFQKCVKSARRKHVHFVDDVNLFAADCRRIVDAFAQFADVVDTVVGCRIDFDHVKERTILDGLAGTALTARLFPVAEAVEPLGQKPRCGRLAGASRSAEQVGMARAVRCDLIL